MRITSTLTEIAPGLNKVAGGETDSLDFSLPDEPEIARARTWVEEHAEDSAEVLPSKITVRLEGKSWAQNALDGLPVRPVAVGNPAAPGADYEVDLFRAGALGAGTGAGLAVLASIVTDLVNGSANPVTAGIRWFATGMLAGAAAGGLSGVSIGAYRNVKNLEKKRWCLTIDDDQRSARVTLEDIATPDPS